MTAAPSTPAPTPAGDLPPVFTTREEEHLYLLIQRFSFCLDRHVARLGGGPSRVPPPDGVTADPVERISLEIAALDNYLVSRYFDETLPISRLCRSFGLDTTAALLLAAATAPALDLSLARRLTELTGSPQPQAGFLVDLLTQSLGEERLGVAALRPTAPLVRWRLVRLGTNKSWSPEAPVLHRPVMVPERIVDWLRGDVGFDPERFDRVATLHVPPAHRPTPEAPSPPSSPSSLAPSSSSPTSSPSSLRDLMVRALFRTSPDGARRLPLVVSGPALAGKATAVVGAAATRGLPVLDVDLESLAVTAQPTELLLDLAREAMLHGAVLLLRRLDAIGDKRPELRRTVMGLLTDGALWVAATTQGEWRSDARRMTGAQLVEIDLPDQQEQLALWHQALPSSLPRTPELDLNDIVGRYRLTPGDILEAGLQATRQASVRGAPLLLTLDDVVEAVRGRLRHRLGDVAELITTTLEWDDIVLSESVFALVLELLSSIRFQSRVMVEWGFARKVAYGRAVSALFSGPPGTGKTMVATLIAKELGLELFRVDLSRVVSKWVGETEKNLGRAFDEAKNSQAVLLFDEADALFAKRTDVKSSNDRYANLEVNYLLQRLEAFEGIVLLTTNNQSAIDDAFRRRLRFRIEFPSPEEPERELLWQSMLPPQAPCAPDVNFHDLARRYEMSGGYIKNAVVRAAYLAAAEEHPIITQELLTRAAQLEWEAMGRLAKT